ncbi:hypothetical protein RclHR1_00330047 [Rhizophagus clarus]|nr:hypothetical protein RclHR1_00330047 [Rhizophagus clarus]
MDQSERSIEWIPYSQFTNVVEIAKGEFCIIYHATWNQQSVILKKFKNFQDTSKYFLDELKSNCYEVRNHKIRIHDVTKDLKVGDYLLVTQYASGGILHKWFESEFSNYLQYNEMNPKFMIFGSTPILRSSPIPIKFISFNKDDIKCIYCEEEYAKAVFSISQRYCKKCLSSYLINISDINIYLDVYILTQNGEHETSITKKSQDIQGCRNFLDILCFKQIPADDFYLSNSGMIELNLYKNMIENEKFCKLCGETLYEGTNITEIRQFILCSNCYLISTGHIDSISSKKPILVIYLPWWHNISCCVACSTSLTYASDCQKYCEICLIFYIGCRYCLTTNIIFGLTIQSQCMKCERISSIIMSENSEFLLSLSFDICNNLRMEEFSDKIKNNDKYFLPSKVNSTIHSICQNYKITQSKVLMDKSEKLIEWIPYFQFTNVVEIAKGEFGIIYRATWMGENVILKKFKNSQDASKYFLNEVRIMLTPNFYEIKHHFIKIRGVTKDSNYILVMQYASEDLNNWFMSQKENSISYVKNYKYVEISNSSQNEIDHIKFLFLSPTPKLKPSLIPIKFISFNENDYNCDYCGEEYTKALFSMSQGCRQRYCKKCLSSYLTNITEINIYLDIRIFTRNLKCNEHEISGTKESQNIQECCRNCLDILFFKQIPVDDFYWNNPSMIEDSLYDDLDKNEEICELCGKSLYQETNIIGMIQSKLCSGCYLISAGYMVSISTKKHIPVINLPWWHNISSCVACNKSLIFASDCQKYCENCLIFYIGCRYCLTTNIIFGITIQSQCKKCERISSIIVEILSGNNDLDDFIINLRPDIYNNLKMDEFSDKIKNNDTYFLPSEINSTIQSICQNYKDTQSKDQSEKLMEWIPYSQFTNVEEIAKGGFGIIYRATWVQENVILKKFKNSQDTSKYFLNELKSNQNCYEIKHHIIRTHGITKNPELGDYMLVMQYASGGDLHNWLQNKFEEIKWNKDKLIILWQISEGLETIHKSDYIHRDFHSGNILYDLLHNSSKFKERHQWLIGDLGLSQPANDTSNNEIYGVIPYIAPEIFKGSSFSKESDVYSMGMIMWELTTGCKPFANVEHDINLILRILDGERPEITEDTPGCYADLMKSCWDPDPKQRPSAKMIRNTFGSWSFRNKNNDIFDNAELKRNELLKSEKLGPEFAKKPHPKAIYTSRSLSPFISKCSSINSSLSISSCIKQGDRYTSTEQDLDIDIDSARHSNVIYPIRSLNVAITSKKRNIEESNVEIHDNSGKHIKTNSSYPKET